MNKEINVEELIIKLDELVSLSNEIIDINKDYGLMQINSSCFKFLKKGIGLVTLDELYSPYTNVNAAFALLNYHYDNTGDNDLMLLRYQVGEGRYDDLLNGTEKLPDSFWNTYHIMEEYKDYFEKLK